MAEKKAKKTAKKSSTKIKITKDSGNVIYRENTGDNVKNYKAKGYKVEEV
jgi:hypothetical protein|tara:strand:- start:22 stop:171 length:150 start_codon:yes stop_codon:yes gene_type:complete